MCVAIMRCAGGAVMSEKFTDWVRGAIALGPRVHGSREDADASKEAKDPGFPFDPGELEGKYKRRRYARSRLYLLTCEYVKLRSDLRIAVSSNWEETDWHRKYAEACQGYLENARRGLESRRPRIFFCASMLDLAAGSLVWLYDRETVELRSNAVTALLEALSETGDIKGTGDIKWLLSHLDQAGQDVRCKQAALADTLEYLSRQEQGLLMEDSLQVTRLRRLLLYVGAALALLIIAAPFVTIKLGKEFQAGPSFGSVRYGSHKESTL